MSSTSYTIHSRATAHAHKASHCPADKDGSAAGDFCRGLLLGTRVLGSLDARLFCVLFFEKQDFMFPLSKLHNELLLATLELVGVNLFILNSEFIFIVVSNILYSLRHWIV